MLSRFFAFVIVLCFLASSPVGASTHAATLRQAMNDFNYAVNVEWDQQDPAFYEAQMDRFQSVMGQLSAQGMTQVEMLNEAKSMVKDARTAAELEVTLQLIESRNLSSAETKKLVMDMMKSSHSRGASWSGSAMISVGVLVGVILLVALVGGKPTCGGEGQLECATPACAYGYHYQCFNYYDQFGVFRLMSGCDYAWSCL